MSEPDIQDTPELGPQDSKPGKVAATAEAANDVKNIAAGVAAGGVGGVAIAGKVAVKRLGRSKNGRRFLGVTVAGSLALPLAFLMVLVLLTSQFVSAFSSSEAMDRRSSSVVVEDAGLTAAQLQQVMDASEVAGIPWQVMAAMYLAQSGGVDEGGGPYQIVPESADDVSAPGAKDLKASTLFLVKALRKNLGNYDVNHDIADGALVLESGEVRWRDEEEHDREVRQPWAKAMAKLPVTGASEEWGLGIIDQAVMWRLGKKGVLAQGQCLSGTGSPGTGAAPKPIELNAEQMAVATEIYQTGRSLKIPDQGIVIAFMTAFQESAMRNLEHGDRDSQGAFQQRPVSGWGTVAQITNVKLATTAFFGLAMHTQNPGLVDIKGWETMQPGVAAQKVQRSAFPGEYAKWEGNSRWLLDKLSSGAVSAGTTTMGGDASFVCGPPTDCPPSGEPIEPTLKPDAQLTLRCLKGKYPSFFSAFGGIRPNAGSHTTGNAIDAMLPNPYTAPATVTTATQAAEWLVQNHTQLGIEYVILRQRIWHVSKDKVGPWTGWRLMEDRGSDNENHFNHIHITTYDNKATGFGGGVTAGPGQWVLPIKKGAYVKTSDFNPFRFHPIHHVIRPHRGTDFASSPKVQPPIYAIAGGKVIEAGPTGGAAGTRVQIDTGVGGFIMKYAHLSSVSVRVGQTVSAGTQIGRMGTTGGSTGEHLHLEFWKNGTAVDPIPVMRSKGLTP